MVFIAGIDPGMAPAYAILDQSGRIVNAGILPTLDHGKSTLVDARAFQQTLRTGQVTHTVIENVATRPGQGIVSSGHFMKSVGTLYGVAAIHGDVSWVTPVQWKRFHGLLKQDKEASRLKALELWPNNAALFTPRRKHLTKKQAQDVAEAALIANWFVRTKLAALVKLRAPLENAPFVRA